jgi:outer membrane protein assembly factor BamB
MMKAFRLPGVLVTLALGWALTVMAADPPWSRFRGPNGCGASEASTIPATWTAREYRWKVALPGVGFSSPAVWGDRLYTTSTIEAQATFIVLCLKTSDGSVAWKQQFKSKPHPKFPANCDASATPAVDKDRVYVVWATPDEHVALALDRQQGTPIWRRELGPYVAEDGFASSPVLAGDVVVLSNDQDPGGTSSIVALDRQTGRSRWQIGRQSKKAAFSTPCLFEPPGGRAQVIVTSCAHGITSLDPAKGIVNWELGAFEVRTAGSPLLAAGTIFASNGGGTAGKYLVAAQPGIPEQAVPAKILYRVKEACPYVPTPVAKWPLVFLWSDRGVATCIDGPTGKVHWRQRIGGDYLGSPVRVGDRIYCIARSGEIVVLAAADTFQLLARIDLGEGSNSTPAVADGVLYLRTVSHLMSLASP